MLSFQSSSDLSVNQDPLKKSSSLLNLQTQRFQIDKFLDILQNRVKMLEKVEEKSKSKIELAKKKAQKLSDMRINAKNMKTKNKLDILTMKSDRNKETLIKKQSNRDRILKLKEEIEENNKIKSKKIKETKKQEAEILKLHKQFDFNKKKASAENVKGLEIQAKYNIKSYQNEKINDIHSKIEKEKKSVEKSLNKSKKLISFLEKQESELLDSLRNTEYKRRFYNSELENVYGMSTELIDEKVKSIYQEKSESSKNFKIKQINRNYPFYKGRFMSFAPLAKTSESLIRTTDL